MKYYVYILTTNNNNVFYVGVTNNLVKRVHEHKTSIIEGFTKKYHIKKLVYYEEHADIHMAIYREKRIKRWNRKWKIRVITEFNRDWLDLYDVWFS